MKKFLFLIVVSFFAVVSSRAEVKLPPVLSDHMVLQRDMPAPVWGEAAPGEKVTVKFRDQEKTATADGDGKWMVKLDPLKAGGPDKLTVTGSNTITLEDVYVGEVWLCGGQSNMQFGLKGANGGEEARAKSEDAQLRLFDVPRVGPTQPKIAADNHWRLCDSNTVAYFSAVGYFFGRDLRKDLNVPIGLISANVGGSIAQRWTPWKTFTNHPALKNYTNDKNPAASTNGNVNFLYTSMIVPVQPFAIRGVIWYQGESNAQDPAGYQALFPALIDGWREAWNQPLRDFPFLFVQLATGLPPEIRQVQLAALKRTPNTAMAVITDCEGGDLHPKEKEPVGQRLALAARALAYGEKIEYSGPIYDSIQLKDSEIVVTFQHTGRGLVAKDDLKGFTIAGADKKFFDAIARIDGTTVVVSSTNVPSPRMVRYGWSKMSSATLYNKEGLPASPFASDWNW